MQRKLFAEWNGVFLSPLSGLVHMDASYPRLAPWAAFLRRFAADLIFAASRLILILRLDLNFRASRLILFRGAILF
jgi:hypothetical protein